MSDKKIEQWEVERYWEIFSSLSGGGSHLTGNQAASVLKNSQLSEDQLAKVWDLADVDNDGSLDFEEFCVAMRLIFDLVNGDLTTIPTTLPEWLIPSSKAHLVAAHAALSASPSAQLPSPPPDLDSPTGGAPLKDNFDWYMSPGERRKYEEIYGANRDHRGEMSFAALAPLYADLDVPDTDIHSAWNLVNPSSRERIGKDACLAFLHVLSARHEGFRVPRSVPPSLRASFERGNVDHRLGRGEGRAAAQRGGEENTASGRKAKFGDTYLSRLGKGSSYTPQGTDFSSVKMEPEWEEVRLRKELKDLEAKIERVEREAQGRRGQGGAGSRGGRGESKSALVRRELEQMLDWKRRELRRVEEEEEGGSGKGAGKGGGGGLKEVREEVGSVREQVEGLEAHLRERERVLEELRREIEGVRAGR